MNGGLWEAFPGVHDLTSGPAEDGLLLDINGTAFGLPAPVDVAGVHESVTLTDDTGMTICSDTDGDGKVDSMSVVTFDGGWSSWRLQESMAEDPSDRDMPVSLVTEGSGSGGDHVESPDDQKGVEQEECLTEWHDIPPSTPGNGRGSWDARGWECVDRGNWG